MMFAMSGTKPAPPSCSGGALRDAVRDAIVKALPSASPDPAIGFLQWLGVFDPSMSTTQAGSVVKTFCALLEAKLKCVTRPSCRARLQLVTPCACTPLERGIFWSCIMKWRLSSRTARKCTSARTCSHTRARLTLCSYSSTMLSYGVPHGDTAMALTVNSPQLPVSHHASHVARHTSHVTRHTSHVTRHTSHVTHQKNHSSLAGWCACRHCNSASAGRAGSSARCGTADGPCSL